jgi:hypothetical protein
MERVGWRRSDRIAPLFRVLEDLAGGVSAG